MDTSNYTELDQARMGVRSLIGTGDAMPIPYACREPGTYRLRYNLHLFNYCRECEPLHRMGRCLRGDAREHLRRVNYLARIPCVVERAVVYARAHPRRAGHPINEYRHLLISYPVNVRRYPNVVPCGVGQVWVEYWIDEDARGSHTLNLRSSAGGVREDVVSEVRKLVQVPAGVIAESGPLDYGGSIVRIRWAK